VSTGLEPRRRVGARVDSARGARRTTRLTRLAGASVSSTALGSTARPLTRSDLWVNDPEVIALLEGLVHHVRRGDECARRVRMRGPGPLVVDAGGHRWLPPLVRAAEATAILGTESLAQLRLASGATAMDADCGTGVAAVGLVDIVGSSTTTRSRLLHQGPTLTGQAARPATVRGHAIPSVTESPWVEADRPLTRKESSRQRPFSEGSESGFCSQYQQSVCSHCSVQQPRLGALRRAPASVLVDRVTTGQQSGGLPHPAVANPARKGGWPSVHDAAVVGHLSLVRGWPGAARVRRRERSGGSPC